MSWEDSEWEDFDRLLSEYRARSSKPDVEVQAFYPCPPDPFGYVHTAVGKTIFFSFNSLA